MMDSQTKHCVIGMGEVGSAIFNTLKDFYSVGSYDQSDKVLNLDKANIKSSDIRPDNFFDVIHICFGHRDSEVNIFKDWVRDYQKRFLKEGGLTIVHSTTAIGVCDDLEAVHSPIVGNHYQMEEYVRKATKIFGGERSQEAAELFRRIGMKVLVYDKASESEAAKLFLTESYRVNIEFCQRVKRLCDKLGLEFSNVYVLPSMVYNSIYKQMGHEEYVRPILAPNLQEISGHCVKPNEKLIKLSE